MTGLEGGKLRAHWVFSFLLVLALHAALIAVALYWQRTAPPPLAAAQPQAVMVELAQVAAAPDAPASDLAPGPQQQQTVATQAVNTSQPSSEPLPVQRPTPPLPSAVDAIATQQAQPSQQTQASDEAQASAPPQVDAVRAARYAARQSSVGSSSAAFADWQAQLLGHLERFKRYPRAAQRRRQEGVVQVQYTVDRQGNVLAVKLDRGSGSVPLDEEALAAVQRASPLPPPPADVLGERLDVTTPVQFSMR